MLQVIDGEIKKHRLPKVGILKDGTTVSGYHLLSDVILKKEGWLPLEEIKPQYDPSVEYLKIKRYEILEDKVIKHYDIKDFEDEIETEVSLDSIQEDSGMLALMVSMLMAEVDMLKAQIGGM